MGPETMVGYDKLLIGLAGVTPSTGTTNLFAIVRRHSKSPENPEELEPHSFALMRYRLLVSGKFVGIFVGI